MSRTRPKRTQKVPPLGSLRGTFPEETNALNESDRCLTSTQLRQLSKILERSSESDETTTNPPSSASSDNDWDSASDDVPKDNNESIGKQVHYGPNEKILYDACTIRTWFMMMDTDGDGVVSKDEFVTFLRDRPILPLNDEAISHCRNRTAQALLQRRLIKLFNEIDTNKSKRMEFEEFLTVFRRAGYLLEYALADNPRDRAAELLASVPVTTRRLLQRCRRGSESGWAIEQQERLRARSSLVGNDSPRRDSDSTPLASPAAFWEEPVVLGSRRPSWGRRHSWPAQRMS